ncbi:Sodium- and chloride-dependent glycine transporter 1 [Bulinus truncatus]|nr:Sodium- and chloride-dependent glycine transporter 1 [Bulinus truncatus]
MAESSKKEPKLGYNYLTPAGFPRKRQSDVITLPTPIGLLERPLWGRHLEFIVTCIGFAVGLGNIWRFPHLAYANGGGVFLIPYTISLFVLGIPLFCLEILFGQFASLGPITIWEINPLFKGLGYTMVILTAIICVYYNVIVAMAFFYLFASMQSLLPWATCGNPWNTCRCRTPNMTTELSDPLIWVVLVSAVLASVVLSSVVLVSVVLASVVLASVVLASVVLASVLLVSVVLARVILAIAVLANVVLVSVVLASVVLSSVVLATVVLASVVLSSVVLASVVLSSVVLANVVLASAELANVALASVVLACVVLASVVLASVVLASVVLSSVVLVNAVLASVLLASVVLASVVLASGLNFTADEVISSSEEYFYRYVLRLTRGIHEPGQIKWDLTMCNLLAWIIICLCLIKGVSTMGKVSYFFSLFPYLLLTVLFVRGITLEGAEIGIKFYLSPNIEKLYIGKVWQDAASQIFFSLSCCTGSLTAMASYNKFDNNVLRDSIVIPIINCLTSFYAGFAIFSILGFMAHTRGVAIERVTTEALPPPPHKALPSPPHKAQPPPPHKALPPPPHKALPPPPPPHKALPPPHKALPPPPHKALPPPPHKALPPPPHKALPPPPHKALPPPPHKALPPPPHNALPPPPPPHKALPPPPHKALLF